MANGSGNPPETKPDDPGAAPAPLDRGSFLGFVAHEMRNPLSTALWSAELLARLSPEERAGARGEKLAGMALRSLQRLRLLVEDHFLSERLAVGGLPVRFELVPLAEALDAAEARAGAGALTRDLPAELVLAVDRGLAERALEGLLAVAGRGKAPVHVAAGAAAGAAVITVRGIAPEPDALAPPQKGTASDPTGRALALLMAGGVAQALGGSLRVEDGAYLLRLPLAPPGGAAEQP